MPGDERETTFVSIKLSGVSKTKKGFGNRDRIIYSGPQIIYFGMGVPA